MKKWNSKSKFVAIVAGVILVVWYVTRSSAEGFENPWWDPFGLSVSPQDKFANANKSYQDATLVLQSTPSMSTYMDVVAKYNIAKSLGQAIGVILPPNHPPNEQALYTSYSLKAYGLASNLFKSTPSNSTFSDLDTAYKNLVGVAQAAGLPQSQLPPSAQQVADSLRTTGGGGTGATCGGTPAQFQTLQTQLTTLQAQLTGMQQMVQTRFQANMNSLKGHPIFSTTINIKDPAAVGSAINSLRNLINTLTM